MFQTHESLHALRPGVSGLEVNAYIPILLRVFTRNDAELCQKIFFLGGVPLKYHDFTEIRTLH